MIRPLLRQFLAVCVVGSAVGLVLNSLSAHGIALSEPVYPASAAASVCTGPEASPREHPRMSLEEALRACADDCTAGFVDARGAAAYAHGHIPGALRLPPEGLLDEERALEPLRSFTTLVVYDDEARCELAQKVADRLVAAGFPEVRLLDGNWTAWQSLRGPVHEGACEGCSAKGKTP